MLYLKSWLQDYINLNQISSDDLANLISARSGEVESFTESNDYFNQKVLIGKIQNVRQHPDADRLKVFEVNLGNNFIQIVSAAENVFEGLICPVALVGCSLPGGMVIQERQMRGEISQGMCCGKSELLLETGFSSGLWELNEILSQKNLPLESFLGKNISQVLPEYFPVETVFDIKYLADKFSQCSSHLGLALELAGVLGDLNLLTPKARQAISPEIFNQESKYIQLLNQSQESDLQINFQDETSYSRTFSVFEIGLEKDFEMPHIFLKRMFLTGQNIVGSMVDLSNYLLRDVGQPSHFFDLEKLVTLNSTSKNPLSLNWKIQKSQNQRKFQGLGQLKNTIIPSEVEVLLQINLENQAQELIHIPGISGGVSTKLEPKSRKILIEVANFPPEMVAKSSFALNYRSDGGRFWSNRVNPALQFIWLEFFLSFMLENGVKFDLKKINLTLTDYQKSQQNIIDVIQPKALDYDNFDYSKSLVNTLNLADSQVLTLLQKFEAEYIVKVDFYYIQSRLDFRDLNHWESIILEKLNLVGKVDLDNLEFYPNVFYSNDNTPEDLLFQVARLNGLDNLAGEFLNSEAKATIKKEYHNLLKIKKMASSFGFQEIISRPFINPKDLMVNKIENSPFEGLKAISSQREDENFLQDSLLPNLLKTISENLKKGHKKNQIFETNKIYKLHTPTKKIIETLDFDLLLIEENPYKLTTFINILAKKLNLFFSLSKIENPELGSGFVYFQEKNTEQTDLIDYDSNISFLNQTGASLLEICNKLKKEFNIPLNKKVWYLHLNLAKDTEFNPYNFYPDQTDFSTISRGYSFFVEKALKWANLEEILTSFELNFEVFIKPVERLFVDFNTDILNFEMDYYSYNRTLTTTEVENLENQFFNQISSNFGRFEKR
jgi:phenylalanyl-tRNA synthetase beta chain